MSKEVACRYEKALTCAIYKALRGSSLSLFKLRKSGRYIGEWGISNVFRGHGNINIKTKGVDMDNVTAIYVLTLCAKTIDNPVIVHVALKKDKVDSVCNEKEYENALKRLSNVGWWLLFKPQLKYLCSAIVKDDTSVIMVDGEKANWGMVLNCDYNEALYFKNSGDMYYATYLLGLR